MDLGRCFVIRDFLRPSQVVKYPQLMGQRKLEGEGLHVVACRKLVRSSLVAFDFIALQEISWDKWCLNMGLLVVLVKGYVPEAVASFLGALYDDFIIFDFFYIILCE